ncbi:MAG: M6 family metalloprotease domain-containing protein [Calditrichota bacterium]
MRRFLVLSALAFLTIYVRILLSSLIPHPSSLFAMPPAPGLVERLRAEGRLEELKIQFQDAHRRGVDASHSDWTNRPNRDDADETTLHAICLLADFEDNEADRETYSTEHYQQMLFSRGEYRTGSVRDWYWENSYQQVDIVGQVFGWYRLPHDYAWYVQGERGFGGFPQNAQGLVRDVLAAADNDVNFAEYDNDNNSRVEALFVVHAGPGAETNGSNDMIWSHSWNVAGNPRHDGMRFRRYAMEPEDGRIGVFGHELGHSLFGLPDLYDTGYESSGIGRWSMMAAGSNAGDGARPVHFDIWCKKALGWLDLFPIVQDYRGLQLNPSEFDNLTIIMWRNGEWDNEFFLVENRQRIGFDGELPGSGILIWHIDEDVDGNTTPWWPGQGGGGHYKVALEQADGLYQLEHDINSGDAADPFPGATWNTLFTAGTDPSSRDYRNRSTNLNLHDIERADSIHMRLSITIAANYEPEQLSLFFLNRMSENHEYIDPDKREDSVYTNETDLLRRLFRTVGVWGYQEGGELPARLDPFNTVLYVESWRDGDEPAEGLNAAEQSRLATFVEQGGNLILVGPDVATNLDRENGRLWPLFNAEYISEGSPQGEYRLRTITANAETRVAGQNFPFYDDSRSAHYIDEVAARSSGAQTLFADRGGHARGVLTVRDNGARLVLQPFLFGGLIDWGGSKDRLLSLYFNFMQYYLTAPEPDDSAPQPASYSLLKAWPNPFNSFLNIAWTGQVQVEGLIIYDVLGRRIDRLTLPPDLQNTRWSPQGLGAGMYYLVSEGGVRKANLRVVYVK